MDLGSDEGEDIISNLPDFIIGMILSRVPIEDAVRTCVLSKRWINLWKFITHLVFQERVLDYSEHRKQFLDLVNGVMLNQNDSCIDNFTLIMNEWCDPSHVDQWISAALSRRVKTLKVVACDLQANLPSYSILKFMSLQKLSLKMNSCAIRVPSSVCLPSLTILRLSGVALIHDHGSPNNSADLTLKFPVLRELEMHCNWFGVNTVTLEVPLLQVAYLSSYRNHSFGIKFCASRLTKFTYEGYVLPHPRFLDLSAANIASAELNMVYDPEEEEEIELIQRYEDSIVEELRNRACNLLKQFICNVECLEFQWFSSVLEVPQVAKDSLADLPTSRMLTSLKIESVGIEFLLDLLLKTPALKTLSVEELLEFDQELLDSAIVPDCIQYNLEVVELFYPDDDELEPSFAKFVLENAQVLKRMKVNHYYRKFALEGIKEKMLSFEKASSVVTIEFQKCGHFRE